MWCVRITWSYDLRCWALAAQDLLSLTIDRQCSICIRLHNWGSACGRLYHFCSLDHIPGGTATWRWCRYDCNHDSPHRCHHPTAWQDQSGSCWCPEATFPCGELALPCSVQLGPHGWDGGHDSLFSMFQKASWTIYCRWVRHEGQTVVDVHIVPFLSINCVCLQCHIGTNAGQHVTIIGDQQRRPDEVK